MKQIWLLFGTLLAMWIVLGATLTVPESARVRGFTHPEHQAMKRGGAGLQRHGRLLWHGWAFGALQLIAFVCIMSFGARRRQRLHDMTAALLFGLVLMLFNFSAIFLTYYPFISGEVATFLGPFPEPTTLATIGMWATPFYFVALYVVMFPRCIYTPEDAAKFQHLLQARKLTEEDAD